MSPDTACMGLSCIGLVSAWSKPPIDSWVVEASLSHSSRSSLLILSSLHAFLRSFGILPVSNHSALHALISCCAYAFRSVFGTRLSRSGFSWKSSMSVPVRCSPDPLASASACLVPWAKEIPSAPSTSASSSPSMSTSSTSAPIDMSSALPRTSESFPSRGPGVISNSWMLALGSLSSPEIVRMGSSIVPMGSFSRARVPVLALGRARPADVQRIADDRLRARISSAS
mmetsp:Transcript_76377/g.218742  ORF Transcript_76377/g.218742 Transcript_76377/m.218742 type:complete len:228 (+) Transcript_76377:164-847(+)